MRICIVGAGSIGGLLGVRLALAGNEVTVVARGANLAAIQAQGGMRLIEENGEAHLAPMRSTQQVAEAGQQDLVILGMKAHQVAAVVRDLPALYHEQTMVMTAQNGIPWWYFFKHGGPHEGQRLASVDPGGIVADHLPVDRVIGTVVYPAAEIAAPGVIRHIEGNRFSVGEIDNADTPRIQQVSQTLREAGFKAPVLSDIRAEIWLKLWGNLSFNPISALTHATLEDICRFPLTRALAASMMTEAQAIGEALGIRFRVSLEKRIAGAEAVGAHKTSMLQDIESGRPVEIDALVGSVQELGRVAGIATPHLDTVYAIVKLLAQTLEQQQGQLRVAR